MSEQKVTALVTNPVASIQEMSDRFTELEKHANVVSPLSKLDHMLPMHRISLRTTVINTDPRAGEVYRDGRFCQGDEVALTKNGMLKLMGAAGVNVVSSHRLDDRQDPFVCEYEVTLSIRQFDGTLRTFCASKRNDFRDGQPEVTKKDGSAYAASAANDMRRHIVSLTQTKAMLRALRGLLNLKQKYTKAELSKPFVVPVLVPDLDPSDPDVKRALLQAALGVQVALYGDAPEPQRDLATQRRLEDTRAALLANQQREGLMPRDSAPVVDDNGEVVEVSAPDAAPVQHVCTCPCGDQNEVSPRAAEATLERGGGVRCAECWPTHATFDRKRHADLDLKLPLLDCPE